MMNLQQLFNHLSVSDLEFNYKGKWYFICPINNVYSAGEANKDDTKYKTFEDLVNNFQVEGKPLKDILERIDW
ncbi:MAG: hypothetical protein PHC81_06890 [Clostridia bacterium]|nr:hypothetical protein [Clostridia bacterium]